MRCDEKGWRIPRAGTQAHEVYRMAKRGFGQGTISRFLRVPTNNVGVMLHRIRRPAPLKRDRLAA